MAREPEYGPGGYLPPRAAKRARKIVLRERMGLGWPLAAVVAAAVIAVAGAAFLASRLSPPRAPWVAAGPLAAVAPGGAAVLPADGLPGGALVVRGAGDIRAFVAPGEAVGYCASSGKLESPRAVWALDGRLLSAEGGESLERIGVTVFDATVYVNPAERERLARRPGTDLPTCVDSS